MAECGDVFESLEKSEKVTIHEEQDGLNTFVRIHIEPDSEMSESTDVKADDSGTENVTEIKNEFSSNTQTDIVVSLPSTGVGQSYTSTYQNNSCVLLPWGARKEKIQFPSSVINVDTDVKSGEFIMRTLFAEFVIQTEKKVDLVMSELEKPLSKSLQRGEDMVFDQLLSALGSGAEHCLPSLLRILFSWYEKQMVELNTSIEQKQKNENKSKNEPVERNEKDHLNERRDLAVEFVFCLVLIEVLKQLTVHPGHEDLVNYIENLAFRHFKFREGSQSGTNATNNHIVADLYAEVIGVLAQSRLHSVKKKFMGELKELRSKEPSPAVTQSIISLLMGMKFFRIKMVPIEEFEASFQFMQECAQFFLEVKDKDIKHALAGLFVEILVPVAAIVKNEVNVPVLKNFVEMLYSHTLDMATKKKHCLALFPLVTCLLCVSQKTFFLQNWHYFLAMCLSHLKNKDPKMSRVALESVYMIRIKCESNTATQSRLQSIVNSLFPKGSKAVVPRDTPLNIFVKIIQFIAQERLDFAMKEIVFDLLSVGRPIKIILTPERMSIGLRAFLVVADSLQQKEGDPPMPRTIGVLPSGNTLRIKKTFINKMLTEDAAKSIGISSYYPHVRKSFNDILKALDVQFGRPLMMTNVQNVNKELDDMITGERKPKIDLFRTCVAAIPRLIPDGMNQSDLVDLLARLTVHGDEELRGLAFQSLQNLIVDFPDWREDVVYGFVQFIVKEVNDTFIQLLDNDLRMLLQLLSTWRNAINNTNQTKKDHLDVNTSLNQRHERLANVLHCVEGFSLVMLCNSRLPPRRLAVHVLKEIKLLDKSLNCCKEEEQPIIDVLDKESPVIVDKIVHLLPAAEKSAFLSASCIDLQWLTDRTSSVWVGGYHETTSDSTNKVHTSQNLTYGCDVWSICLSGFLERISSSPAFSHSWPILYTRLSSLFAVIDPNPINDNRASLLRSATTIKKPINERDAYLSLWKNYVIPPHVNPIVRCASPDLSLSSSPDSINSDRYTDGRSLSTIHISPTAFYKLIVPLLRSDVSDIRDSVVNGLGRINSDAIKDVMEELLSYMREAIDRKQENMRRRRRRDALRVQLVKVFEMIAKEGTFGRSSSVLDGSSLHPTFLEYIDGARQYLESENEKDVPIVQEIKSHFCGFICELINSFSLESRSTLLSRTLRQNLFYLFASWSGKFGVPFGFSEKKCFKSDFCTEFEMQSLLAMSTVLCCGPVFDTKGLLEDGNIYQWLDILLGTHDEKIYHLAQETIVLLLEFNPDMNSLLDWVVDRCYTGTNEIADGCFSALATIFSAREYPCDHYTAIINVTLMNTGCPRANIHETALQLLQVLDKRFFGNPVQMDTDLENSEQELNTTPKHESTLDVLLSATYSRSQMSLSKQLANLHPELTMPMFSEITHRFQTARHPVRQILLHYLLPWLYNMELVDPNIPPVNPLSQFLTKMQEYYTTDAPKQQPRREGWGSAEATEMVLNNLFYITAKWGDDHAKEIEELWAALCSCWPNNLKVIIRYLFIVSGMAPNELLIYAKRVVMYLGRARPERLVDEMMNELQTVETLNCLIERTETPPFFRVTSIRKTSSHSDAASNGTQADATSRSDLGVEKGTIHTKRHSGEDPLSKDGGSKSGSLRSTSSVSSSSSCKTDQIDAKLVAALSGNETALLPELSVEDDNFLMLRRQGEDKSDTPLPHPLPMPEYGGYFAPLTEFLPDSSQPISGFHRCNLAVMLLTDFVLDGVDIDWSIHIPLMLHIIFLGLDHTRPLVYEHCKKLLLNLLIILTNHNDHLSIAKILLNNKTEQLGYGVNPPGIICEKHNFTEPGFDLLNISHLSTSSCSITNNEAPIVVVPEESSSQVNLSTSNSSTMRTEDLVKSLIDFIASKKSHSLWSYEDITARMWSIRSAEQLETFLRHILQVFKESQPHAHIEERWAQIALQLALSCSSRHYAGRSLQVFRALRVPISTRMLSDILSRLVETGYVTEIMLTLEAAVDSLDSDFRPMDFVKELFKSTPNLNKDNRKSAPVIPISQSYHGQTPQPGHTRSTSYSVSYCLRRATGSPTADIKGEN
uniref:DAD domain-containing protein n=1 Tax=Strigamia maritima TaxID=126957 RepID=T1J0K0_STRMM